MKSVNPTYTLTTEQVSRLNALWNMSSNPNPDTFVEKVLDAGIYQINYRRDYTKKMNEEKKEAMVFYKQVKADRAAMVAFGLATEKDGPTAGISHTYGGNGAGTGDRTGE